MSTDVSNHKKSVFVLSGLGILLITICVCFVIAMTVYGNNKRQAARKQQLSSSITTAETNFYVNQGYFIPITDQNVDLLMQHVGAKKSERSFVIGEMQEWTNLQIPEAIDPPLIDIPGGSSSSNCSYCWDAWKSCHSICRMCMGDECNASQCYADCDASVNSCQASCR